MGMDLFEFQSAYPNHPGYKDRDGETSREAAEEVSTIAGKMRLYCLGMLHSEGPMTADEVAERLDKSPFGIRPRFSELKHADKIEDSGERRKNGSGRPAIVWRVK